jgi:flagellar basal body P-ring formation protein FlgA
MDARVVPSDADTEWPRPSAGICPGNACPRRPGHRCHSVVAALLVVAAAAVSSAARAAEPETLVVTLRPHAAVGLHTIRIGDVADLVGGALALRETVAALDLADATAARQGITVKREQVDFRIRLAGVPENLFRVGRVAEARVEPERCSVAEADVLAAAKEAVLKRLPWGADDVSVQTVQPIAASLAVDAPRGEVLIRAEPHSSSMPLGRVQMDVGLWAGGARLLAFPLYLDVRLYQKVAVALRRIERGEALGESSVTLDRRPVEGLRDYLSSAESLTGKRARQTLFPGRVLTATDVEDCVPEATPMLVRRGEAVKLLVRLGSVNVMASGEALQDGRAGQSVRVRNIDSKQVVLGRVTERSLVEVEP